MYDESIEVSDADEVLSSSPRSPFHERTEQKHEKRPQSAKRHMKIEKFKPYVGHSSEDAQEEPGRGDSDASDNSDEDDDEDDAQPVVIEGAYDPKEYDHLLVGSDVKELFQYITFYTPQSVQLEYKLEPFVPDYIPAVGDIDGFLKVGRPDGEGDGLGLAALDEPSAAQSDPAVAHLHLRAASKQSSAKPLVVKKLENAEKTPKAIDRWIKDIQELHKSKPPPTLHYSKPMPDIDGLMQEWPPEFERKLNEVGLPLEGLDTDLLTYVDLICALFDIPRYESRIESLHVLFSLYSAIKNYKKEEPELPENANAS